MMVVCGVFGDTLSSYGWTLRGFKLHAHWYLCLLLVADVGIFLSSRSPQFQETYPFYHDPDNLWKLLAFELLYACQFCSLEFFFRGFMLHSFKRHYGSGAVWMMVFPYMMLHHSKPLPEAASSAVGGTVLAVISLRTGSVVGGCLLHVGIAWSMDVCVLARRGVIHRLLAA